MGRFAETLVRHRWATFLLLAAMTGVGWIGQTNPDLILRQFRSPPPTETPPVSPATPNPPPRPPAVSPLRVTGGDVIVVARSPDFFTPSGAAAMRDAVDSLEALDHVRRVLWIDRIPTLNLFAFQEPILPEASASPQRFADAKERAQQHPLVRGQLMSPDGETLLLMVKIDWLFVESDADVTDRLRETAASAVDAHPEANISFAVTGEVPIRLASAQSNRANEIKYQLIGYGTALGIALVLFRGLTAVIIVGLAPALGVFWTLGLLPLVGVDNNPFSSVILPVLICMVGFTDGVHMMVQIRRHRSAGMAPTEAARRSIREVGLACWLTSLTTAIAFGSLAFAHHEIVREFGVCCVIGVMLTFLSVITVIPWACVTPLGNRVHQGAGGNVIDRQLGRISGVVDRVLRRSRAMSFAGIAGTLALGVVAIQLRPDERLRVSLPSGGEAAEALAHIDRVLGGLETARVEVGWTPQVPSDAGEIATVIDKVDRALRSEPLIGHPLSIAPLLAALPGEGPPAARMSLLELLPPPLKRAYFRPEYSRATVQFRIQDLGIARYGPVFERVTQELEQIEDEHPEFGLSLGGDAVSRWRNLFQVVLDLVASLGTASLIIFGILTLAYRSFRLGLISVVPNLFPLAATGSLMWITGQRLELVSVCAFTVCLGIAVDDTIHFLTRFREERDAGKSRREAIHDSVVGVGTALIMTTVVLVIGFSTALLSDVRDHRVFATMGILTITAALFADVFFLPALLLRFAGRGKS